MESESRNESERKLYRQIQTHIKGKVVVGVGLLKGALGREGVSCGRPMLYSVASRPALLLPCLPLRPKTYTMIESRSSIIPFGRPSLSDSK